MFYVYGDNMVKIELPSKTIQAAQRWASKNGFCEIESANGETWVDVACNGKTWIQL